MVSFVEYCASQMRDDETYGEFIERRRRQLEEANLARIAELEAQVKALVRACEALVEANDFDDSELLRRAIGYARAALAQVRVETGDGRQCLD